MRDRSIKQLDFQTRVLICMCLYLLKVTLKFFFLTTPRRRRNDDMMRCVFSRNTWNEIAVLKSHGSSSKYLPPVLDIASKSFCLLAVFFKCSVITWEGEWNFSARGVKINTGLGENVYVLNTEVSFTNKMGLSLWCGSRRSCRFFFMASLTLYS